MWKSRHLLVKPLKEQNGTTDVALCFDEAYEIYATRWTIEVFF